MTLTGSRCGQHACDQCVPARGKARSSCFSLVCVPPGVNGVQNRGQPVFCVCSQDVGPVAPRQPSEERALLAHRDGGASSSACTTPAPSAERAPSRTELSAANTPTKASPQAPLHTELQPARESAASDGVAAGAAAAGTTPSEQQVVAPLGGEAATKPSAVPRLLPLNQPVRLGGAPRPVECGDRFAAPVPLLALDTPVPAAAGDGSSPALQHLLDSELGPPKFAMAKAAATAAAAGVVAQSPPHTSLEALLDREMGPPKFAWPKGPSAAAAVDAPSFAKQPPADMTPPAATRKPSSSSSSSSSSIPQAAMPPSDAVGAAAATAAGVVSGVSAAAPHPATARGAAVFAASKVAAASAAPPPPPLELSAAQSGSVHAVPGEGEFCHLRLEVLSGPAAGVVFDTRDAHKEVRARIWEVTNA